MSVAEQLNSIDVWNTPTGKIRRLCHDGANEILRLRGAIKEACDLLAERTHGNPARSAGHNARLCLEGALRIPQGTEAQHD
jgi:hypothetical protein